MRDARREAFERLGGRFDVRVLEPSPPAVADPPFFADDPLEGGEVVPVERPGSRSWASLCAEDADTAFGHAAGLRAWCEDRWLVRRPLAPLPPSFSETRSSLHALAEHVIVPCRHAANGKIGLRFTYHGFGTPFFGADRQVRVEDGVLLDGERRHSLTTLAAAAAFLDVTPGAPAGVYTPTTGCDLDQRLTVDPAAARVLGDWFGFTASLLEELRAGDTARMQLWPEHFDLAITLGQANYGGSPGDAEHPEPYLYVGPWEQQTGPFWNEPFGASLSYGAILGGADPVAFLHQGRGLLRHG